jgi:hypothetical protein
MYRNQNLLMLDEDESFSLTANVTMPGYQSVVVKGYLVSRRSDGTYIAPLIPQLFYGVSGEQLTSWRQYLPQAGEQVILSRVGGKPEVPREELFWRRVPSKEEATRVAEEVVGGVVNQALATDLRPLVIVAAGLLLLTWGKGG